MIHTQRPSNPQEGEVYHENGSFEVYSSGTWRPFVMHGDIFDILNQKRERRMKVIKVIFE
jgi:hypothetical protein